jgi:hypothetical protein
VFSIHFLEIDLRSQQPRIEKKATFFSTLQFFNLTDPFGKKRISDVRAAEERMSHDYFSAEKIAVEKGSLVASIALQPSPGLASQGDQIGRIFAFWASVCSGQF